MLVVLMALLVAAPEQSFEPAGPLVRAPGYTYDLSVASSGSLALVVWTASGRWGVRGTSVYAGRVDAAGQALDPEGLLISVRSGSVPSVAWLSSQNAFVVVWEENEETFLRLVRTDGTFHPSTVTPLRVGAGRRPFVTVDDARYVVTAEASHPVMWRFVGPATQLDLTAVALSPNSLSWASPVRSTVTAPGRAVVSWVEGMSLAASFVSLDPAGPAPVSLPVLLTSTSSIWLDGLRTQGTDAVAAYRTNTTPTPVLSTLRFGVDAQGVPEAFDAGPRGIGNAELSVLGTGALALLATGEPGDAVGWALSDAGPQHLGVVATGANSATTAPLGALELVARTSWNGGVTAQLSTQQLVQVLMPVQLGNSRGAHQGTLLAASSQGYVASWLRLTDDADLVTWPVSTSGTQAAAPNFVEGSSRYAEPSLTSYAGGAAMLTGETTVRVMDATGTWGPDRVLPTAVTYGSITTDRAGRLVGVGLQYRPGLREGWAVRFEPDGGFTERLIFPDGPVKPYRARAAFARDGSGGGLVITNPGEQVWANRLTSDLVPLDDAGFLLAQATAVSVRVAADTEGGYLVFSTNYNDVEVRRLSGAVVSPTQVVLAGAWDFSSVVEVTEGALVVATNRSSADVVAVLVTVAGGVISVATPVTVASGGEPTTSASVAVRRDGFAFVYGRLDFDAGVATTRYQVWSSLPGSVCSQAWQCASGRCMNGVCGADAGIVITPSDGGVPFDGGVFVDAGSDGGAEVDAGPSPDAGITTDGGVEADAGIGTSTDAGVAVDAGVDEPNRRGYRAGCDCQQAGGLSSLVLAVVLARRRRR